MHILQYSIFNMHQDYIIMLNKIFKTYLQYHIQVFSKYNTIPNSILQPRWSPKDPSAALSAPVSRHDHHR